MATSIQVKRGVTAKVAAYTPLSGELVLDTTLNRLSAGDGSTAGGKALTVSASNITDVLPRANGGTAQSDVSYLRAESTTATSLTASAFTKLVPTVVTDTKSAYSSGTWTCPDDGYYQVTGFLRFAGNGTGYVKTMLKLDSASSPTTAYVAGQTVGDYFYGNSGAGEAILNLSCILYLTKGSAYSLYAYHNYSAALAVAQQAIQIIRVA